jgi:secondary thiamine-phosphate synthase enzyme
VSLLSYTYNVIDHTGVSLGNPTLNRAILVFMAVYQHTIRIKTKGNCDVIDITPKVREAISTSRISTGVVNVSGLGSTLAVTTLEFEPGCVQDLKRALDRIAPPTSDYAHNAHWGDNNGYSHSSALLGTAKTFPVIEGHIGVGTWQQIVLCDLDDRPREREVTVTVVGE